MVQLGDLQYVLAHFTYSGLWCRTYGSLKNHLGMIGVILVLWAYMSVMEPLPISFTRVTSVFVLYIIWNLKLVDGFILVISVY